VEYHVNVLVVPVNSKLPLYIYNQQKFGETPAFNN